MVQPWLTMVNHATMVNVSPRPFSEANVSSQAPHFRNPGRTTLPEKKLSAPPPRALHTENAHQAGMQPRYMEH